LLETEFSSIVKEVWKDPIFMNELGVQQRIVWKLKTLKQRIKFWAKNLRKQKLQRLEELEEELQVNLQEDTQEGGLRGRDNTLKLLETERNQILLAEETLWRQRSRATWIKCGDQNSKFFHRFASSSRNKKHIWEIKDETGFIHTGQKALKSTATKHFKYFYGAIEHTNLIDQVSVARLFPRFVTEEDSTLMDSPCTLQEVWEVLKSFAKDKIPGPDGWTVEFFLHFFDLVGVDLLELVEDTRTRGKVIGSLNSTFLTLIPKVNNPSSFGDYRPISLCNLCYKLISKVIANRIKPILSRTLSGEQLGFLKGRQILDAIGTAQECLHSIKMKNSKALILKLDLKKAFDCIDWDFLRMILIQSGFSQQTTKWILSCVTSANFVVLVNGETSPFFHSGRGLRQGCPLSPLLFILVMEGLSLQLKKGQVEGKLTGVKVSRIVKILHLFFIDDVLIMTNDSLQEWKEIKDILTTFCSASGLKINWTKSTFHYARLQEQSLELFKELFPYNFVDLSEGFKYLGYYIKVDSYKAADWNWLVAKVEKRIGHWCNRWLSLGGRFTLIKAVLECQPVYWMALAAIPVSVLDKLRKLTYNFLWSAV
jgi:hypothetical protein